MRKITLTIVFSLLIFSQTFSQTPTPTPIEDDDEVVKITTNLVQIDVSVTDRKGNPITDLKAEDFEIYENGKKQDITNFSFISNSSVVEERDTANVDKNNVAIPVPPKMIRPDQVRRTIALVVDDLSLSFESAYKVRRSLKYFVNEQMQEGDLVAIIRTGAGVGALQQFTADKQQLLEAIKRVRWNANSNSSLSTFAPLRRVPQDDVGFVNTETGEELDTGSEEEGDGKRSIMRPTSADEEYNVYRQELFTAGTIGALGYIIRGMETLPGRKSVMLFSDGFALFTPGRSSSVLGRVQKLVDMANRSSVVIYTLDARGLVVTSITAADDTGGRTPFEIQETITDRSNELFRSRDGLTYLAKETGGFAFFNQNSLKRGIRKVLKDQSYYLIGYQPDDASFDPDKLKFNRFVIKVKREGVRVRYRSGYLGVSDEQVQRPIETFTPQERIANAMTSPFAVNDINLSMKTLFKSDTEKNLYLYSFLHIGADKLTFEDDPDGSKKATFDVVALGFGDKGFANERFAKTYTINIPAVFYEEVLKEGLVYSFLFPLKKPGAYQMRVVIRDHGTGKVGSASEFVMVPKLKKDRLTLSGIALENMTYADWSNRKNPTNQKVSTDKSEAEERRLTSPRATTALRKFPRQTILGYGIEIYNAQTAGNRKPELEIRTRLFRENKLIFEGKPSEIDVSRLKNFSAIPTSGALKLGESLVLGDYVLQVVVLDKRAKEKRQIATQFIQFEVVD